MKFDVNANKDRSGIVHKCKHMKVCSSKELEEAVFKWYTQERSVKVNVLGTDLLNAATKLARHMGIEQGFPSFFYSDPIQYCQPVSVAPKSIHIFQEYVETCLFT